MTAVEVINELSVNYFTPSGFGVRIDTDASPFPWVLVRVLRQSGCTRLFGLRFVDYPLSPPTLRFWQPARWDDAKFVFDFTSVGDAGMGTSSSGLGVPTMCIPFHVDYYKGGWHTDQPWTPATAEQHVSELVYNVLRRS
jgi:hypothetical protein